MKFGVRKPSIKRSISARTTGDLKRTVNKTINPLYGKKGMGYINDPKKAVYNKVYNKTTIGTRDIWEDESSKSNDKIHTYSTPNIAYEDENFEKLQSIEYTPNKKGSIKLIIFSAFLILLGMFTMPFGILFAGVGVFLFFRGKDDLKIAERNETNLPALTAYTYTDENGNKWVRQHCYTRIDIVLCDCTADKLKVNQSVKLQVGCWDNKDAVRCLIDNKTIGYINPSWQRDMIFDYVTRTDYLIMAQISFIEKNKVFLRVVYYRSKQQNKQEKAEVQARYKTEKSAYVRKQPVSFDTVLVYNGTEKMQWEIQQVHKGDKIEVEPDGDNRYLVSTKDAYDIGYLHKRISERIDDLINDGYVVNTGEITEITETSGKFGVKVHIVLEDRNYL